MTASTGQVLSSACLLKLACYARQNKSNDGGFMWMEIAQAINGSALQNAVVWSLRNVWGLPPIVQTIHILSIAAVMASIVMIDLKVLGLALPNQQLPEMLRRLLPWTWWALLVLFVSGAVFVIGRPRRYFVNPVFGMKFALLAVAVTATYLLQRLQTGSAVRPSTKLLAAISLFSWLGVMLAGRWIAYVDYLFPPE